MKEINSPVKDLIGKKVLGVVIDDSPELREWLHEAEQATPDATFQQKLYYLTRLVKRLKNANSLSHDPELSEEERQKFYEFVWKPSLHPNLSEALQIDAACCRYYHVLFFVLAAHIQLGRSAFIYGKLLPNQNFGYTWVKLEDTCGIKSNIDLYEETILYSEDHYEDPSGKYRNGKPFIGYSTL